jgi:hypothetical protein
MPASSSIQWLRIVVVAVLIELALILLAIPFYLTLSDNGFIVAVLIAIVVVPFLMTRRAARKIHSRLPLHGFLIGLVASLIYLGLLAPQPGGIQSAAEMYGTAVFLLANILRIAAAVLGTASEGRRRAATSAAVKPA